MKFGKTLYELRKQAGLSQKELANLLDVAQASINYWETLHSSDHVYFLSTLLYFSVFHDFQIFIYRISAKTR